MEEIYVANWAMCVCVGGIAVEEELLLVLLLGLFAGRLAFLLLVHL